ncbi:MAG TPA: CRISPR-associated RAMP protein [Oscillatoriaceae cyanobacterium M33_DOE_052]|uniref:CRISPR-associated RAMP protein n=1 Tax=Planktothricoides sp. SpSt-374 TaxID=2282167 RepID=A0A7C3VTE0_9CYAN|nr:CRISPR-associated RAMP protein [Oscillatoriaceae cyanobacterium M33_DOE_052]
MFDTFKNRLKIEGTLWTVTALRIGAGRSTEPIGSDLPVIKDALGRPFIPGSSLKGALRSRLESFLRGIDPKLAGNPANQDEWSITAKQMRTLKERHKQDKELTVEIEKETDFVSRLFGSPWVASKLQIRDLTVTEDNWFGQYQERDGVAIERDTETAAEGKLYDFQVVPPGTPFEFRAIVENAKPEELGLLVIGLYQLETEQIPLGGGRSRGLGVVKLEISQMRWFDSLDKPELILEYISKLTLPKGDATAYEDGTPYRDQWVKACIAYLSNQNQQRQGESV